MSGDLRPEEALDQIGKGRFSPYYLFYGESEFLLEKVLETLIERAVPQTARDLNFRVFYGDDEAAAGDALDTARSLPFLSDRRLLVVRRTEKIGAARLDGFLPYLEDPVPSTCIVFVCGKPDFKRKFYQRIRQAGCAVHFARLQDRLLVPWIKKMAKDLGLEMEPEACLYLQQMVGNRLRDLYSELEKLSIRFGRARVGTEEVKALAVQGRSYTVFELVDAISFKKCGEALKVLSRFLEEEDREGVLKVLGMLNRQLRLLWDARALSESGSSPGVVAQKLQLYPSFGKKLVDQSKLWRPEAIEKGFELLYAADGRIKSGAPGPEVLSQLCLDLCR
jgi:DNA polymerase-3 subunit delta